MWFASIRSLYLRGKSFPNSGVERWPWRLSWSGATPAGTGNAYHLSLEVRPILWRAQVALGRRNARKAVGYIYDMA